jgi:galactoside O-acetyltransferase
LKKGKVIINEHVIIGAGSVILPNVEIGEGVSIGALSLVNSNLKSWTLYIGNPLKKLSKKSRSLLKIKNKLLIK